MSPRPNLDRKKPIVVEAMQFDGLNGPEIMAWVGGRNRTVYLHPDGLMIHTLDGSMLVSEGDWIIKGIAGESNIFLVTHEPADSLEGHA